MTAAHPDEPFVSIRQIDGVPHVAGARTFFRGHLIPSSIDPQRPDGIYAQWTWDGAALTVRTDRYGASPLFYAYDGNRLSVSPSLIRLVEAGAPTSIDEAALALFLRLGFFVGDDTPFRSIHTVPPGATLVWREGVLQTNADGYRFVAPQRIARDAAIDGFVDLFRAAMRRRPAVERDVVVPLSGGRDSRHILLELCASGHAPDSAVTISRFPPRSIEDDRIAPIVAAAAGVRHVMLEQTASRFEPELRKNWDTHLCADEHAWSVALVDALAGRARTVYDGLGGALSVPNRFSSRDALALFAAGRFEQLAASLLSSLARWDETFLMRVVHPSLQRALSLEVAIERFAAELRLHASAADSAKSFNFWNRIRRELALVPHAMMRAVPTVYTPYLDHELYDFLFSLPPEIMSPTLSASDKSFHSEAVLRGYPDAAHIPFDGRTAAKRDARAVDARFAADAAAYLLPRLRTDGALMNRRYVASRLLYGLARRQYREISSWLPSLALYLAQLGALIQNPRVVPPHVVGGSARAEAPDVDRLPVFAVGAVARSEAQVDIHHAG